MHCIFKKEHIYFMSLAISILFQSLFSQQRLTRTKCKLTSMKYPIYRHRANYTQTTTFFLITCKQRWNISLWKTYNVPVCAFILHVLYIHAAKNETKNTDLAIFPVNFHNNVCKHQVLVIRVWGRFFPFLVLFQPHIITFEWMWNTAHRNTYILIHITHVICTPGRSLRFIDIHVICMYLIKYLNMELEIQNCFTYHYCETIRA